MDKQYIPEEVHPTQAVEIIQTRKPLGKFYLFQDGMVVGIDNETGEAWVEQFDSKDKCIRWLVGEDDQ